VTRRPRRSVRLRWLASALLLPLAVITWMIVGPGPASRSGPSTTVMVQPGVGVRGVASELASAGVISMRVPFILSAVVTGAAQHLKAGEYAFPDHASLLRILWILRRGQVVRHAVTIPEGLTSAAAIDILRRDEDLTGDVAIPVEGAILPDTYDVTHGEARAAVVARMHAARVSLLDRLWRDRSPGLPYQSADEAMVLASVVEKETSKPEERPHIAGLFLNRLRLGMRLESDPTVIYGVSGGVPLGHGLRASELARRTPYNTYQIAGLPPTPIANPGRAALEAVFKPQQTDDLYFVADGTGGHAFAATLAAHQKNVARWRALERSRAPGGSA